MLPIVSRTAAAGLDSPPHCDGPHAAAAQSAPPTIVEPLIIRSCLLPIIGRSEPTLDDTNLLGASRRSQPSIRIPTDASCDVSATSSQSPSKKSPIVLRRPQSTRSERSTTEMVKAISIQDSPEIPEIDKGSGRRHTVHGVHYKAFINRHGSELSIHDRYIFGSMLGEGAVGSTWEAFPLSTDGSICSPNAFRKLDYRPTSRTEGRRAIKKMLKHCVPESARKRFLEEVDLLKELDHPNICKLYEVFDDSHALYLVMDMCEGGELFDRIADGELGGEQEIANVTRQIAHALRYCHETHGIVHRDIKPENVLFVSSEPEAPVKLIDFGIACHFKGDEALHERIGTEPYEAPEVLSSTDYTEKCDLWSLGVILYCMLSGSMPFASVSDALHCRFSVEGDLWSHVSAEAKDLISQLLVLDPHIRFSAAQALQHPWMRMTAEDRRSDALPDHIILRLRRFSQTSNFRKILLVLFARHLDTNDVPEMYDSFNEMDTDGDGKLSLEEFQNGFTSIASKKISAEEIHALFEAIDIDGSGAIDYSEFLSAAVDRKLLFREDLCLQVFRALDRDSDGTISLTDLDALLHDADTEEFLGRELRDEAQQILRRYDVDADGKLDFHEFTKLLTHNKLKDVQKAGLRSRFLVRDSESTESFGVETWAVAGRDRDRKSVRGADVGAATWSVKNRVKTT